VFFGKSFRHARAFCEQKIVVFFFIPYREMPKAVLKAGLKKKSVGKAHLSDHMPCGWEAAAF
jgi:hypothetical protein